MGRAATWGAVSGLVFASLVIATWGFVALGLDRDVIDLPGVGILVAPLSVAAATVIVALSAALALRRRFGGKPGSLWVSLPGSLLAWLAFALVSGIVASGTRPEPGETDALSPLASEVAVGLDGPFRSGNRATRGHRHRRGGAFHGSTRRTRSGCRLTLQNSRGRIFRCARPVAPKTVRTLKL